MGSSGLAQILQSSEVYDGSVLRTYVLTYLAYSEGGCHACAPRMGAGVFQFKDNRWQLESLILTFRRWVRMVTRLMLLSSASDLSCTALC